MNYRPSYPTPPPGYGYIARGGYNGTPPPMASEARYYPPRFPAPPRTSSVSPRGLPKLQGHSRGASHAVPPPYSNDNATPHRAEYVPIYDPEPKASRPRRAYHTSRPQPSLQSKRVAIARPRNEDIPSDHGSDDGNGLSIKVPSASPPPKVKCAETNPVYDLVNRSLRAFQSSRPQPSQQSKRVSIAKPRDGDIPSDYGSDNGKGLSIKVSSPSPNPPIEDSETITIYEQGPKGSRPRRAIYSSARRPTLQSKQVVIARVKAPPQPPPRPRREVIVTRRHENIPPLDDHLTSENSIDRSDIWERIVSEDSADGGILDADLPPRLKGVAITRSNSKDIKTIIFDDWNSPPVGHSTTSPVPPFKRSSTTPVLPFKRSSTTPVLPFKRSTISNTFLAPQIEQSISSPADVHGSSAKPRQSRTDSSRDRVDLRISGSKRKKDIEQAMLAWFPSSPTSPIAARKTFNETDLRGISNVLRRTGNESWSRVPRIYATLRVIDQLPEIDGFLKQGLSDVSFPFNNRNLPMSLKCQAARSSFLEAQKLVLTKALDLERESGKHRHFSNTEDIPFQRIAELGKGGFSFVDHVLSTISFKEYARKLIPRGRTFRKDQEVLKDFEKELTTLKRLSHKHVVELVGSYTDPRYVGIIMSPVADCNLKQFLDRDPLSPKSRSFLPTFFGCLTSALRYLHENSIRHRDIKPQNVLVKSHQVLLTDFGISRDWSELGHSTTEGPATKTPRYCAPEVAAERPRNSSSDIWSLGCVFLEIWSVLCGETVSKLTTHMESSGSCTSHYHQNTEAISSWCNSILSTSGNEGLDRPYMWITSMLKETPDERWIVQDLFDRIQETNADPNVFMKFTDHCCIDEDDTSEDAQSSDFEHDHTDTTRVPDVLDQEQVTKGGGVCQRCYRCKAVVVRRNGCNHQTCRCTAEFCVVCAAPWKTCNCPWFDYCGLEDEDEVIPKLRLQS